MARRKIVKIDEEKCNGCGQCVDACAEGAIEIIDGKARLVSETYCDGLGDCLGECPQGAITIEEREAELFNEAATKEHLEARAHRGEKMPCGCPGTMAKRIEREPAHTTHASMGSIPSELTNWPVQLRLVPSNAPYFRGADLLLAADCVPFALADFHSRFLRGKPLVIGCPKLDDAEYYVEKLADVLASSSVKSLTVVHMEVPCCSALTRIAEAAIERAGVDVPLRDATVSIEGQVIQEECIERQPSGKGG
ncbi:MAG: 4Fe-4S binding protein [Planctomycetota bacterium]